MVDFLGITLRDLFEPSALLGEYEGGIQRSHRIPLTEDELLWWVNAVLKMLDSVGQPVTWKAVAEIVGVSVDTLKYYPSTRRALQGYEEERKAADEQRLIDRMEWVIVRLGQLKQPITQRAVCRALDRTRSALFKSPRLFLIN